MALYSGERWSKPILEGREQRDRGLHAVVFQKWKAGLRETRKVCAKFIWSEVAVIGEATLLCRIKYP